MLGMWLHRPITYFFVHRVTVNPSNGVQRSRRRPRRRVRRTCQERSLQSDGLRPLLQNVTVLRNYVTGLLSACGWAAGPEVGGQTKLLVIAANQGEATFESAERLRSTPSRAGGGP